MASAHSRFSLLFSVSSAFSRLASDTSPCYVLQPARLWIKNGQYAAHSANARM
jgi:hypothetical protein